MNFKDAFGRAEVATGHTTRAVVQRRYFLDVPVHYFGIPDGTVEYGAQVPVSFMRPHRLCHRGDQVAHICRSATAPLPRSACALLWMSWLGPYRFHVQVPPGLVDLFGRAAIGVEHIIMSLCHCATSSTCLCATFRRPSGQYEFGDQVSVSFRDPIGCAAVHACRPGGPQPCCRWPPGRLRLRPYFMAGVPPSAVYLMVRAQRPGTVSFKESDDFRLLGASPKLVTFARCRPVSSFCRSPSTSTEGVFCSVVPWMPCRVWGIVHARPPARTATGALPFQFHPVPSQLTYTLVQKSDDSSRCTVT